MVARCAHRVSCAAETLGAMHQEHRISRAVFLADRYLQLLQSKCEKLAVSVAETKWGSDLSCQPTPIRCAQCECSTYTTSRKLREYRCVGFYDRILIPFASDSISLRRKFYTLCISDTPSSESLVRLLAIIWDNYYFFFFFFSFDKTPHIVRYRVLPLL